MIAREEIRRISRRSARVVHESSQAHQLEVQDISAEFGAATGHLTGDARSARDAPLVVGTTEVYRNQLSTRCAEAIRSKPTWLCRRGALPC